MFASEACTPEPRRLHGRAIALEVVDPPLLEQRSAALSRLDRGGPLSPVSTDLIATAAESEHDTHLRGAYVAYVRGHAQIDSTEALSFFLDRVRWDPDPEVRRQALLAACGSDRPPAEQIRVCMTTDACEVVAKCLVRYGPRTFPWLMSWATATPRLRRLAADVVCDFAAAQTDARRTGIPGRDAGPWLADALAILDAEGAGDRAECMHDLLALSKIDAIPATPCAETP